MKSGVRTMTWDFFVSDQGVQFTSRFWKALCGSLEIKLSLEPGNQAWLFTVNLKPAFPSRKLGPKFVRPFPVKRKINDVAYELKLSDLFKVHPVFHVNLLKPAIPDPFPEQNTGPLELVITDSEEEFEVEGILQKKV